MHYALCNMHNTIYTIYMHFAICTMCYAICALHNAKCKMHSMSLGKTLSRAPCCFCCAHGVFKTLYFERRRICKKLYFTLKHIFCIFLECILNNELAQSKLYTVQNLNAMTDCTLQILCYCATKFSCILCNNVFCEVCGADLYHCSTI